LDNVPATPTFAERLPKFEVLAVDGRLGSSPFATNVMVQLLGQIDAPAAGTYAFSVAGGNESRVFVDGVLAAGPLALSAGIHTIEARVAVATLAETPVQLLASFDGGSFAPIDPAMVTHSEAAMIPVINLMSAGGLPTGGNIVRIQGLGFFTAEDVVVNWGGTPISGDDLTVSYNEISLVAPPGAVGTI